MNKKEEKQILRIQKSLDNLYDIVEKLEYHCMDENFVVFKAEKKVKNCKNKLLKLLDKIQKITDKMLVTE